MFFFLCQSFFFRSLYRSFFLLHSSLSLHSFFLFFCSISFIFHYYNYESRRHLSSLAELSPKRFAVNPFSTFVRLQLGPFPDDARVVSPKRASTFRYKSLACRCCSRNKKTIFSPASDTLPRRRSTGFSPLEDEDDEVFVNAASILVALCIV